MLARADEHLRGLSPSYFALVMATGIVSVAAELLGIGWLADALFALNIGAYAVLSVLTVLRLLRHRAALLADLTDHRRGPGFLTLVAATGILGGQMLVIGGRQEIATALLVVAIALWLLLTYTIFTALTIKRQKPSLAEGISGTWLLAVVATQSVAALTALLAPHWGRALSLDANFFALSIWLWGGMLYIWIIALIFYRHTFLRFSPADLAPSYWINMGAMAISALAGSLLISNSAGAHFLGSLRPFLEGFTVFYWATGTWWIPMIAILVVWRYVYHRHPIAYDPLYWGAVFPLGMYAVATLRMAEVLDLDFLDAIPRVFLAVALAAWLATFVGLARRLAHQLGPRPARPG